MTKISDDREYARAANLPDWLRGFADSELKKGANTFDDIKNLFKNKSNVDSVENCVSELRERVGLDAIEKVAKDHIPGGLAAGQPDEKYDKEQMDKGTVVEMEHTKNPAVAKEITKDHLEESEDFAGEEGGDYYDELADAEKKIEKKVDKKSAIILSLIALADELDAEGNVKAAQAIDERIKTLAKNPEEKHASFHISKRAQELQEVKDDLEVFKKHPKLEIFIRNVCRTRGGHIEVPAIQTMLRNERPENIDVTDKKLINFIKECLKEYREEMDDDGDDHAGEYMAVIQPDDDDGNKEVFNEPPTIV